MHAHEHVATRFFSQFVVLRYFIVGASHIYGCIMELDPWLKDGTHLAHTPRFT